MRFRASLLAFCLLVFSVPSLLHAANAPRARWTEAEAKAYWAKQPYAIGGNFLPADAINQLEMFQAATYDPAEIDRELGWAQAAGMTTMRVFCTTCSGSRTAPGTRGGLVAFWYRGCALRR